MQFVVDGERTPGIDLVERLLSTGEVDKTDLSPQVAAQAIEALEHLEFSWLMGELVEGGERFAEQVHSKVTRGLQELVQNADDQAATHIRFGFRKRGRGADLLVAHDGNPVELHDVLRMALPLLSGSRADPEKIGRFGIGLKTLNQFGDRLAVHCPPLPGFEVRGGRIAKIKTATGRRGFWDPARRETLFVLTLQDDRFDLQFFKDWLMEWDASSLLFLRHLQHVSLVELGKSGRVLVERGVTLGKKRSVHLDMSGGAEGERVVIKDPNSSRSWTRYSIRYPRPKYLKATHKQLGETVLLQLAVPQRPEASRLFAGLPLEEPSELPFSLCAPFEPNVERTHLRDNNNLNGWLIARLGDLATAVSLMRFSEQPRGAWRSVPLEEEGAGDSAWVSSQFEALVARHRDRVAQKVRFTLSDGQEIRLRDFVYEDQEIEGLLSVKDIERLWEQTSSFYGSRRAVPKTWRDGGRWRRVLEEQDGAYPLYTSEALSILDWEDEEINPRGPGWLVSVVHAALKAGEEDEVIGKRCIALAAEGGRLSPADIATSGLLLVHTLPAEGLAASLDLAQQIARPFRAKNDAAEGVRAWLGERGVLREKATDADALRALARGDRSEPIDLRRREGVLLRLRNSFEQLPAEEREEIGHGVGRNIAIHGFVFEGRRKQRQAVRPSEAYLPSAIDKNEGWPTAAATTPGIPWVDTRYRETLRGPRGQGPLAFLKAIGAATAPRLVPANPPSANPHATPLIRTRLCKQHREELSEFPTATGLSDDWLSPDLDAVVGELLLERNATLRRRRARALFLSLDRAWDERYVQSVTAQAARHYGTWMYFGEVSATWIARLASEPWLSTKEGRLKPAAPRDLTVLTEAAFEIEGEHPEKYASEVDGEHVDSPLVAALQMQGRPFASSIVAKLEAMREAERSGVVVAQAWADQCYRALASYAPEGSYADQSDLTPRQLQYRFSDRNGGGGLIRVDADWLSPSKVRREPFLDESLPRVSGAGALWDLLGVVPPTVTDCVSVMRALAARRETNPSAEIRVFRYLNSLVSGQRGAKARAKDELKKIPLRTYAGWTRRRKETIYAVANPVLAEALGQKWTVWRAPLPLEALSALMPLLGLQELDERHFEAEIPAHAVATSGDLQAEFPVAVGQLQDYLAVHHPSLHDRLSLAHWEELAHAQVVAGGGWSIRVRTPRRRTINLVARAHFFEEPARFCVLHEDEAGERDAGGQAIAGFFVGGDPAPEDRSTLALAWADAFQHRQDGREEIDLGAPDAAQDAPDVAAFEEFAGKNQRKRGKPRIQKKKIQPKPEAPRELVDLETVDFTKVVGTFLEAKRAGKLKASRAAKLAEPKGRDPKKLTSAKPSAGQRHYTESDREDHAYQIIEAILGDTHGLKLDDIRDQDAVGADAVDRAKDIWIELKTHGREASDTLRLEPSEALRAEEKRGKFWLVVVWNLEAPRTPEFAVIPDPLRRLDTYLAGGLKLTGIRELAEQRHS